MRSPSSNISTRPRWRHPGIASLWRGVTGRVSGQRTRNRPVPASAPSQEHPLAATNHQESYAHHRVGIERSDVPSTTPGTVLNSYKREEIDQLRSLVDRTARITVSEAREAQDAVTAKSHHRDRGDTKLREEHRSQSSEAGPSRDQGTATACADPSGSSSSKIPVLVRKKSAQEEAEMSASEDSRNNKRRHEGSGHGDLNLRQQQHLQALRTQAHLQQLRNDLAIRQQATVGAGTSGAGRRSTDKGTSGAHEGEPAYLAVQREQMTYLDGLASADPVFRIPTPAEIEMHRREMGLEDADPPTVDILVGDDETLESIIDTQLRRSRRREREERRRRKDRKLLDSIASFI